MLKIKVFGLHVCGVYLHFSLRNHIVWFKHILIWAIIKTYLLYFTTQYFVLKTLVYHHKVQITKEFLTPFIKYGQFLCTEILFDCDVFCVHKQMTRCNQWTRTGFVSLNVGLDWWVRKYTIFVHYG